MMDPLTGLNRGYACHFLYKEAAQEAVKLVSFLVFTFAIFN